MFREHLDPSVGVFYYGTDDLRLVTSNRASPDHRSRMPQRGLSAFRSVAFFTWAEERGFDAEMKGVGFSRSGLPLFTSFENSLSPPLGAKNIARPRRRSLMKPGPFFPYG